MEVKVIKEATTIKKSKKTKQNKNKNKLKSNKNKNKTDLGSWVFPKAIWDILFYVDKL